MIALGGDGISHMSSQRLLLGSMCVVGAMHVGMHACAWAALELAELVGQCSTFASDGRGCKAKIVGPCQ